MSDEPGALSLRPSPPTEADYDKIYNAVMETERGRWFLIEYAKRNRNSDTTVLLSAIDRIEATLRFQKAAAIASPQPLNALLPELEDLKSLIVRTRDSLSDIKPDAALANKAAGFSDIARALERVSLDIRAAVERVQETVRAEAEGMTFEARSLDVEGQAADIADACLTLEHIASQSQKIAMLLHTIEDRIDLVLSHGEASEQQDGAQPDSQVAHAEGSHAATSERAATSEAGGERSIAAGPEWTPPIIQTNGATPRFVEPTAAPAAPIKGPSGWLSKLAPVVSYTARFNAEAETASPQRQTAPEVTHGTVMPPHEAPADRTAMREKIAARTASIFDTYFPGDSFRFDEKAVPSPKPEQPAPDIAGEQKQSEEARAEPQAAKNEEKLAIDPLAALEAAITEPSVTLEAPSNDAAPVAQPVEEKVEQVEEREIEGKELAPGETAVSLSEAETEVAPAPVEPAEPEFATSLMEALEKEISSPWFDEPVQDKSADIKPTETAAHLDAVRDETPVVASAEMRLQPAASQAAKEAVSASENTDDKQDVEDPAPQLAALEAALESFTTTVFDNRYAKQAAAAAQAGSSDAIVNGRFTRADVALTPSEPQTIQVAENPPFEMPSPAGRVAGGSPTRATPRLDALRDTARPAARDLDLAMIPERWVDDVSIEPRQEDAKPQSVSARDEFAAETASFKSISAEIASLQVRASDQAPAKASAIDLIFDIDNIPATPPAPAAEAVAAPAMTADASAGMIAQGGNSTFTAGTLSQPAPAVQSAAAPALQGGAGAQLRRPAAHAPVFGARGFRAERTSGNGRPAATRLAEPLPVDGDSTPTAPEKSNDPLAPVMALSEEERIALFS